LCSSLADADRNRKRNGNANSDGNDYANCNTWRQNYPHTTATSHAAASAVRRGFNGIVFLRGLAMFASPRNAYFAAEEDTRSAESLFSLAQIA
jgi:hypothetical protein